jgi:hypothetical protein
MLKAVMSRFDGSSEGVFSSLTCKEFKCYVVERPWKGNKPNDSCIPAGVYLCKWQRSPKFGWCYEVTHVPGRGRILIHPGNYYWHSHGCLLPASRLGAMAGHKAGLSSRPAVLRLNSFFDKQSFLLEIRDDYLNTHPL